MGNKEYKWEILSELSSEAKTDKNKVLLDLLLANRGIRGSKQIRAFLEPPDPSNITIEDVGVDSEAMSTSISRIKEAIVKKEKIAVYGDYDADGICATAILWECLFKYCKGVIPFIPSRFIEGYGINPESVRKLKSENPDLGLIVTVDNGIVAFDAVEAAKELGIDVIVIDHHEAEKNFPDALGIIYSKETSGSGLAWLFSKEIDRNLGLVSKSYDGLELAAVGIVADQVPIVGVNRSLVKYGIEKLRKTNRPGLRALYEVSAIKGENIGTYEIGFVLAPRLNATGRLSHALDSLRLLCTNDKDRAKQLAAVLNDTNLKRQRIVEDVVLQALKEYDGTSRSKILFLAHENYHEGVIGLAASRLVERFYVPSFVVSVGKEDSKGSARSISGVNIVEMIRKAGDFLLSAGGHAMAAGFSIKTSDIERFSEKLSEIADEIVSNEHLERKLRIDCELDFSDIDNWTPNMIARLEPFGIGNPVPVFCTSDCGVVDLRLVGTGSKHLKLKLESKNKIIDAIGFGFGDYYKDISDKKRLSVAYTIEEDSWSGTPQVQLKIRDIKI